MVQVLHGQENAVLAHTRLEFNTEVKDKSPSHKLCGCSDPYSLIPPLESSVYSAAALCPAVLSQVAFSAHSS